MANLDDIIIRIDPIVLPSNADYTHSGTSYKVARDKDFTDMILDVDNDTTNLLEMVVLASDIGEYRNIYVKVKIHFSNGDYIDWTEVDMNTTQTRIKYSNTIVATPSVTMGASNKYPGKCIIKPSRFRMYVGVGNHLATSYRIETTGGEIVFEKLFEEGNKEYLPVCKTDLQQVVDKDSIYIVKAKHHSTGGEVSKWGASTVVVGREVINDHEL